MIPRWREIGILGRGWFLGKRIVVNRVRAACDELGFPRIGLVLNPYDLLMNEDSILSHSLFYFHLALRRVPDIDCSSVIADLERLS